MTLLEKSELTKQPGYIIGTIYAIYEALEELAGDGQYHIVRKLYYHLLEDPQEIKALRMIGKMYLTLIEHSHPYLFGLFHSQLQVLWGLLPDIIPIVDSAHIVLGHNDWRATIGQPNNLATLLKQSTAEYEQASGVVYLDELTPTKLTDPQGTSYQYTKKLRG